MAHRMANRPTNYYVERYRRDKGKVEFPMLKADTEDA